MRGEINDIRTIWKWGAYGDPDKFGKWIYGRRPDGRTVACEHGVGADGVVWIASSYEESKNARGTPLLTSWVTEFSKDEWRQITSLSEEIDQRRMSNEILRRRRVAAFLASSKRSPD